MNLDENLSESEKKKRIEWQERYNTSVVGKVDVDMLRDRITTFNNLIVRLPVDTQHNCLASKHIFQDWKGFVDASLEYLTNPPEGEERTLWKGEQPQQGTGTDGITYNYYEYYTDSMRTKPLVDYSNWEGDRWDYWNEDDFKWPQ
jgi:hypothetical protein